MTRLASLPGIDDVALTTNGVLLDRHLESLYHAGLSRLTISLDSLDPTVFSRMSGGRDELGTVLTAIDNAASRGFPGGSRSTLLCSVASTSRISCLS